MDVGYYAPAARTTLTLVVFIVFLSKIKLGLANPRVHTLWARAGAFRHPAVVCSTTTMIFPHCFQIGTFTLNLGTRFLLGGRIVTPGYSGHWPGYSGCGVSISIIWTSGPHNQLNGNYHSLSPSLSLSPVTSHSLTSLTSSPSPLSSRF